jgi:tetratricopeptide (TPR) repeat protein
MDLDPAFEAPYTGAAENLALQGYLGLLPPAPTWKRAEVLLSKALALNPDSALAHTLVGMIALQLHCDRSSAERELNRALELSPGNLDVLDYHSYFLMEIGRSDDGIAEKKGILESDPLSISSGEGQDLGLYLLLAGRYDEAIAQLKSILELTPNDSAALARLGQAYVDKGEYGNAVVALKKSLAIEQIPLTLGRLGYAYARWHKTGDALRVASGLIRMSKQRYVSPTLIARIFAGQGDSTQALSWLDKAELGDRPYLSDAGFESLRSKAPFKAIAARLYPSDSCPLM